MRFQNKTALILGSGKGGMGAACALRFAEEGARVVLSDISPEAAIPVADEIVKKGGEALFVKCDLCVEEQVAALVQTAINEYGRIDYAVNAMGGQVTSPLVTETPYERFQTIMDSNLTAFFFALKHEAAAMVKAGGGAIVSISSINSFVPNPRMSAYCASKAAINLLSQTLAMEVGPQGVRVNCIAPGFTATPRPAKMLLSDPAVLGEVLYKTPTRKVNQPEDIAGAAAFLCSEDARNITGTILTVDGGESLEGYPDTYEIQGGLPRTVVV